MRVAIVLAGGASRRFGRGDKLLAKLAGRPLILHAIDQARAAGTGRVLVVIDPRRARLAQLARRQKVAVVRAATAREGLGASLAAGLAALRPVEREALIFLGDMPFATAPCARLGVADALRPIWRGLPGHPMLVRTAAARAARPGGERGLAGITAVGVPGKRGNVIDVDSRAALRAAAHFAARGSCLPRPR